MFQLYKCYETITENNVANVFVYVSSLILTHHKPRWFSGHMSVSVNHFPQVGVYLACFFDHLLVVNEKEVDGMLCVS